MIYRKWRHITKLDPDRKITQGDIDRIATSGTDAIMIGGTQKITPAKVKRLISMLKRHKIPKILEPSKPEAVCYEDVDAVFVPSVINTQDITWLIGKHREWVQHYQVRWEKIVPEAYIVLNPDSAVANLTKSRTNLSKEEVAAYARLAENYFKFPIVYIEYSGKYGDPEVVKAAKESLKKAALFYGGGIASREQALEMKKYADTIIVGNAVYEAGFERFLETIV
ncbi:MAG: phosphoglycerol geranylgeranyltransferase [Methanocellales archaeon]